MPDFYTKSETLKSGFTYAVRGGDPGYTSYLFKDGASALDTFNAFILKTKTISGSPGIAAAQTVHVVFAGSNEGITFGMFNNVVYPFRLKVIGITGTNDVVGLA